MTGRTNLLVTAATDHILRRATYMLETFISTWEELMGKELAKPL